MLISCQLNPRQHFIEMLFEIQEFAFMKMHLKMMSAKWRPFCSGGRLNKKDGLTRYGDSHVKDKTS